jgi:hypothetical protein
MEVGKFILNVLHNKSHMTLSVKPFGCMPSSGVSDGVQSLITSKYPQSIFCAIETSGDGKVNVQSRVQMFLFKARLAAQKEYADLLASLGTTEEEVRAFFERHPRFASPLHRSPHAGAGTAAVRLAEIAPFLGKSDLAIRIGEGRAVLGRLATAVRGVPAFLARTTRRLQERGPVLMAQAREEWVEVRPVLEEQLRRGAREKMQQARARFTRRAPATTATQEAA